MGAALWPFTFAYKTHLSWLPPPWTSPLTPISLCCGSGCAGLLSGPEAYLSHPNIILPQALPRNTHFLQSSPSDP